MSKQSRQEISDEILLDELQVAKDRRQLAKVALEKQQCDLRTSANLEEYSRILLLGAGGVPAEAPRLLPHEDPNDILDEN